MNIKQMMRQAQAMQEKVQSELAELRVEGSAGGGAVRIEMTGLKEVSSCRIDKTMVDAEDLEMLQDLVVAACREAARQVDEEIQNRTSRMLGGMVPGL